METIFRKIEYTTREKLSLNKENVSQEAREIIEKATKDQPLVLRVRVNSPVYIEKAAILTAEGIKEVCKINDEIPNSDTG